jgi:hypothetical protein
MAAEGEFPKVDGDILYASEVNFMARPIKQIYTGTGFDSTITGTTSSDEQSHELTAISATDAAPATYVKVKITGTSDLLSVAGGRPNIQLKAQIKETGQSYADIVAYKKVNEHRGDGTEYSITTYTYEIMATLTAGMKSNGFQIQVFSRSESIAASDIASFTNIQTVVELV